jgi:hypothetical protein
MICSLTRGRMALFDSRMTLVGTALSDPEEVEAAR